MKFCLFFGSLWKLSSRSAMSQTASHDRQNMPREVGRVQLMQGRVCSFICVFMLVCSGLCSFLKNSNLKNFEARNTLLLE